MKTQSIKKNEYGLFYYSDKEMTTYHRTDGPAVEYANGSKTWWVNGKLHREDGPAVECADGTKFWYLNHKCMTKQEHAKRTKKSQYN